MGVVDARAPLPHDLAAEQQLLGAILYRNEAWEAVSHLVQAEHFHQPLHGRIWALMREQIERGEPVSPITLAPYLKGDRAAEEIGGPAYLMDLMARNVTVTTAPHHARMIRDLWLRRQIVGACEDTRDDCDQHEPGRMGDQIAADAINRLNAIAAGCINERMQPMAAAVDGARLIYSGLAPKGPSTGLVDLDRYTKGLPPGRLIVAAGRPGMGKSALAGTLVENVARQGLGVAVVSLEMGRAELGTRAISRVCRRRGNRICYDWLTDGVQKEWATSLDVAETELNGLPILIDDTPGQTIDRIEAGIVSARAAFRRDFDAEIGLVVVDHIGLIRRDPKRNRVDELGYYTARLKEVSKRYDCCVLALCQLSRGVEGRDDKRPTMADLRASGEIEENADAILMLYRPGYYVSRNRPPDNASKDRVAEWEAESAAVANIAEIIVEKNRMGATGTVTAFVDIGCDYFTDAARR